MLSDRLVAIVREAGGEVEASARSRPFCWTATGPAAFGIATATPAMSGKSWRRSCSEMPRRRFWRGCCRTTNAQPSCRVSRPASVDLAVDDIARAEAALPRFGVRHYSTSILPAWLTTLARIPRRRRGAGREFADRITPYGFVAYDQINSGLNEDGPTLASLVGLDRVENWAGLAPEAKRERKERWMDRIVSDLDRQFPGIAGAIVHREMSTSETFDEVFRAVDDTVAHFGRLDILVNNAGLGPENAAENVRVEDFDLTLAVNLKGTFFASQAAGRVMIRQQRGCIVNMSSQAGFVAIPTESIYCMTKAAIAHLTKCLAVEWGKHNIRVNAVAPTFIRTPGTELALADPAFPRRRDRAHRRITPNRRADGRCRHCCLPCLASRVADYRSHHPHRCRRLDLQIIRLGVVG